MRARLSSLLLVLVAVALLGACGDDGDALDAPAPSPVVGQRGNQPQAARKLGFPVFATKNTVRVGGADAVANAAAVAQAVYPGQAPSTRPAAVAMVQDDDWRAGIAASVLMAAPLRAPMLVSRDGKVPAATRDALSGLSPRGFAGADGVQVVALPRAAAPTGLRVRRLVGSDPAAMADAVDRFRTTVAGRPSPHVVVVSADAPAYAMPAAGWAAKSGDSVLYVRRNAIPQATRTALARHDRPRIYLLGPPSVISGDVEEGLRALGRVVRIQGPDPVANAIAFARFYDGEFGWGVQVPGHGLVFATARRPLDAGAAAPFSSSGTYGPLLLTSGPVLPRAVQQYLLDIQPGYSRDPVRGVYNRAWLVGNDPALSTRVQATIDTLLEIVPVDRAKAK